MDGGTLEYYHQIKRLRLSHLLRLRLVQDEEQRVE